MWRQAEAEEGEVDHARLLLPRAKMAANDYSN
jgi:hypothetical protein